MVTLSNCTLYRWMKTKMAISLNSGTLGNSDLKNLGHVTLKIGFLAQIAILNKGELNSSSCADNLLTLHPNYLCQFSIWDCMYRLNSQ